MAIYMRTYCRTRIVRCDMHVPTTCTIFFSFGMVFDYWGLACCMSRLPNESDRTMSRKVGTTQTLSNPLHAPRIAIVAQILRSLYTTSERRFCDWSFYEFSLWIETFFIAISPHKKCIRFEILIRQFCMTSFSNLSINFVQLFLNCY